MRTKVFRKVAGRGVLLASAAVMAVVSAPAAAQETPAAAAAEDERPGDIVVTAQRRNESIQDIPFSITALGEDALVRRNVASLTDYAASVPGVSYIDEGPTGTRGNRTLVIRGIASQNTSGSVGLGTVGYYLDETPVPVLDPQIFDVQRIEILKGPQSTLYGAGSVGGTFRVITNQPRLDRFEGRVEGQLATVRLGDPSYSLKGAINVPIAEDVAAVRLVGWYRRDGGWIDNYPQGDATPAANVREDWNDVERIGGRASIRVEPTERLTVTALGMYQDTKEAGTTNVDLRLGGDAYRSRLQINDPSARERFGLASLVAQYDLGFAQLTSSTSFFEQKLTSYEDASAGGTQGIPIPPATFVDKPDQDISINPRSFTQEVRLVSQGDRVIDWTAGLFYTKTKTTTLFRHEQAGVFAVPLIYTLDSRQQVSEKAAFGEVSIDITDRLTVSGGLRYFDVETGFTNVTGGLLGGTTTVAGSKESGIRPKAYVSYEASDDALIYGTASQGFRAGGGLFSLPSQCETGLRALGLFPPPTGFSSDSVWNYEVGAKTSWDDRRFVANGAVFYLDWSNIQQSFPIGMGCPFQITTNAGSAVAKGFEIDLTFRPVPALSFEFALGYTDARITQSPNAAVGAKGDPLLNVPALNIHGAAQYDFAVGGSDALVRLDYTFVDDKTITFNRTAQVQRLEGYDLVNARVGINLGAIDASVFVENLLNSHGQTDYGEGAPTAGRIQARGWDLVRPRTIGVTLGTRF